MGEENKTEEDLKKENKELKEMMRRQNIDDLDTKDLQKMGLNTALAIALHNFPEGLATFVATLADASVGVTLAIAIAIHNIPEGLCVALPIYYATESKLKGFVWALLSGLSEPIGAFIGWLIIKGTGDDMNQAVYGVLFGIVAGMMVMIVLLELLPTASKYDPQDSVVTTSLVIGMLVMAASCAFSLLRISTGGHLRLAWQQWQHGLVTAAICGLARGLLLMLLLLLLLLLVAAAAESHLSRSCGSTPVNLIYVLETWR